MLKFFTSYRDKYIARLEKEVEQLQQNLADERTRNERLTAALIPSLRRMEASGEKADLKPKVEHKITKESRSATCTCGWTEISDDAAELQTLISEHYRKNTLSMHRRGWVEGKKKLETTPENVA